jgi:cell division protein FtsZ
MILFEDESSVAPAITIGEEIMAPARIKVVGVGGGGGNAVNRMIQAGIRGVEFIAANTDLQVLKVNRAAQKIQLGISTSKGMGAGSNPDVGRTAALEDAERIAEALAGSDMVFVTAGMGGGTGTGAAPVVAKIASEAGALVVAIVSKPFAFEGRRKLRFAEDGIAELREYVDTLITIPNERLYAFVDRNITAWEAFKIADDVLRQAVQGISDLITVPGYVNVDFADVKTVMENMGMALMGTGTATGEHRAVEAAQKAISNPLLEEQSIQGARAILINVSGGEDLTLAEFNEACQIVQQAADDDANIIFGLVQDAAMKDQVKVSVIATGFDAPVAARRVAAQAVERVRPQLTEEMVPEDSGYGVNLVNVRSPKDDIFDIPTFLRRQMD